MPPLVQLKGGTPRHINGSTGIGVVEQWPWQGGRSNHLYFENTGTGPIVLSFTEADATNNVGITVAAGAAVSLPAEAMEFWTKSTAAESFQAVVFLHAG